MGLSKISETTLRGVGGVVANVGVYVASIIFPHSELTAINVMEIACCDLSHPLVQCLLGRDVLARWGFTYQGPLGAGNFLKKAYRSGWNPLKDLTFGESEFLGSPTSNPHRHDNVPVLVIFAFRRSQLAGGLRIFQFQLHLA